MTVVLVCNGIIENYDLLKKCLTHQVIAVDGGLGHLSKLGAKPSLIVGDLDSVHQGLLSQYPNVPIKKFQSDKDLSDTELAMEIAFKEMGAQKVLMFGGFGDRVDHSLYNIALLRQYPKRLVMRSGVEEVFVVKEGIVLEVPIGSTLSLIPLTDRVESVTTKGLKWELHGRIFTKQSMSLSNITVSDTVEIDFSAGELLVCLTEFHRG